MCTNGGPADCNGGLAWACHAPSVLALSGSLPAEAFEVRLHEWSHVVSPERGVDERFDVPELVTGVVPDALKLDGPNGPTLASELAYGVREPDLAIAAGAQVFEDVEDLRLEHVAVDRREVAWSVLGRGFLDDRQDPLGPFVDGRACHHAVRRDLVFGNPDAADNAPATQALASFDELRHRRRFAENDVVAPEHREGLGAHKRFRLQHRVSVPFRLLLHDHPNGGELFGTFQERDVILPELHGEASLEPFVRTEVRVQRFLAGRDHDDDARDARCGKLRDDQLDDRRVDDREELLRYGPAERKEARAKPAGRDNAVAHRPDSAVPVAHCRASALSVKLVGWVVRTANPVTARSGGRRSALVSMSRVSCPFSTACRSTVG